jgi:hypothetical protein
MSVYDSTYNIYDNEYQLNDIKNIKNKKNKPHYCSIYVISHLIISFFAIYLSWKCNNGFNLISFTIALFCPYLYIIWVLATNGGCGIFDDCNKSVSSSSYDLSPIHRINY